MHELEIYNKNLSDDKAKKIMIILYEKISVRVKKRQGIMINVF